MYYQCKIQKKKSDTSLSVKIFISEMSAQICCFVGFYVPSSNGPLFIAAELKEKLSCLLLGCDKFYFIKLADLAC